MQGQVCAALAALVLSLPSAASTIIGHQNISSLDATTGILIQHAIGGPDGDFTMDITAQLDSSGNVLDGFMSVFGTTSDRGGAWEVTTPQLLFVGHILSLTLEVIGYQACSDVMPDCTYQLDFNQVFDMNTVHINPLISNWGNKATGFNQQWIMGFDWKGPEPTAAALFATGWNAGSQLSFQVTGYVPEPGSLTLVAIGLLGLGWTRRRSFD